ncbi:hypothetical protein Holit_01575 [Hollandina sp. SP2]
MPRETVTRGNKADSYGGGVHVNAGDGGSFIKNSGTIDGTNQGEVVKTVFVYINGDKIQKRNSAAGPEVNLDSRIDGRGGGWE